MATASLILRLAHSHVSQRLAALQAQLKLPQSLDFALVTPSGSLLGSVMLLLCASKVCEETCWVPANSGYTHAYHKISSADFEDLRSNLMSKLHSFVPGTDSDVTNTLHLFLGQQRGVLYDPIVQSLVDAVIAALLAKGADPLAPDAKGDNTLLHLVKAYDYAQLIKLLRVEAPWQACGVEDGRGGGAGAARLNTVLHVLLGQHTGAVQPLVDGVITALLAKGADPLATDADGNNAMVHLVKAGNFAQLVKLLRAEAPWTVCGGDPESAGVKGADAPHSEMSKILRLMLEQQTGPALLMDDVIASLLAKGADPLATDADGNNVLFFLAKSGDYARLIKLLSGIAPWKPCGLETGVLFHRNVAGQTARTFVEARHPPANRTGDILIVWSLIEEMETFWTQKIKPTLIHTLTHDCGIAKDAATLCAQHIDGSSSGGAGGTKRKAAEIEGEDEGQHEEAMADAQ